MNKNDISYADQSQSLKNDLNKLDRALNRLFIISLFIVPFVTFSIINALSLMF